MFDFRKLNIREVRTTKELEDVRYLHREIWGIGDLDIIPEHILIAVQKNNGLVLCAYLNEKPIGFSFGFCGLTKQAKPYYYSHNLGVIPEYQNSGVGFLVKMKQREVILNRGLDLIIWTFDPLESRNAHFNMKLGCIVKQYVRDYYGAMPDQLNSNLPSDRLIAEWHLNSAHTIKSLEKKIIITKPEPAQILNLTSVEDSFLVPKNINGNLLGFSDSLYIQTPSNYHEIRRDNMLLALKWRMHLRDAFEMCFESGKTVKGFYYDKENAYYFLGIE